MGVLMFKRLVFMLLFSLTFINKSSVAPEEVNEVTYNQFTIYLNSMENLEEFRARISESNIRVGYSGFRNLQVFYYGWILPNPLTEDQIINYIDTLWINLNLNFNYARIVYGGY